MSEDLDRCSRCGGETLINDGLVRERGTMRVCPVCLGEKVEEAVEGLANALAISAQHIGEVAISIAAAVKLWPPPAGTEDYSHPWLSGQTGGE